jgi:hypothetical protein
MAHGGSAEWNATVEAAVAPLRRRYPVAVAFGMADPRTLDQALDSLAARGVERVAVVRLFLDGRSFLHQTEYLLGLRPDPPAEVLLHGDHGTHGTGHGGEHHSASAAALAPLEHGMTIALSPDGLMQATEVAGILAARARALSDDSARESVLVLAHGTGDDVEDARWIAAIEPLSGPLRGLGFHSVRVETLREDWPERRAEAERRIRAFVEAETGEGRTVLVVPFRLAGFGPYHAVLDGLPYRADEMGLLPHEAVTAWIERQYLALAPLLVEGRAGEPDFSGAR